MDRSKQRWLIVLGILLVCGSLLLFVRQRVSSSSEPVPAPVSVSTRHAAETEPGPPVAKAVEVAPAAATGGTFRGRVIDAVTRRPVRQFEVRLTPAAAAGETATPLTRTFESARGRFAWRDLEPGRWTATVSAHGYRQFNLTQFGIAVDRDEPELVIPLLRGFTLRGRVFDTNSSAGIAGATVRFIDLALWRRDGSGPQAKSSDDGTFELAGVPPGDAVLVADAENYASREVRVLVSSETQPVDIGLSAGGTISGRIVTSAGAPIKGTVTLRGASRGSYQTSGLHQTTEEGLFAFRHLSAGAYLLSATTPVGAALEQIELAQDERRADIMLTVVEGRTLRGTIRGLRPEQLTDTTVTVRSEKGGFNSRPDVQGAYIVKGLPPGGAMLTAVAGGRRLMRLIQMPADRDLVFDIVFPPGSRLSGRVTQGGEPVAGKWVFLSSQDLQGSIHQVQTSPEGLYEMEGVPPGQYMLHAQGQAPRRIAVAGDAVVNIEVPLVQLAGRVLEDAGAVPIVGVQVFALGMDAATAEVRASGQTDDFGSFNLTGVEPGELQLTVFKPGYEMYREEISYSAPITDKRIRLARGGVEIRVQRNARGEPERGIMVMENNDGFGAQFWIPLNEAGIGLIPSGLAGSSLTILHGGGRPIQVRDWDGSPLELKF